MYYTADSRLERAGTLVARADVVGKERLIYIQRAVGTTSNSTTTGAQVDRYTLFIFSHVVEPSYSATCLTLPPQFQRDDRQYSRANIYVQRLSDSLSRQVL